MNKIIGALWNRESKNGNLYMSGVIQDLRGPFNIAVFPNNNKEKENQPDYNIVISWDYKPKEEEPPAQHKNGKKKKKEEVEEDPPY
jgi:uncharacterized protein (DUF736 family)